MAEVIIPETIIVHLGTPGSNAANLTVPFPEYIKNVASSEIYPTWPEQSIRANVLAQISYALNRVYTEWYPSQGYSFDITNSTAFDQAFVEGRDYFDTIVEIVDEIFNNYVVMQGQVQPYFTQYCSGTTVTCPGLSQWGTVPLAEEGMTAEEILRYYYGDVRVVENAPVQGIPASYPGVPLRIGSAGEEVRIIQRQLNRIALNYPGIPTIPQTNGIFDIHTRQAVLVFQQIFDLVVDGIVGKATWYKIKRIYVGIKRLGELASEGLTLEEVDRLFSRQLALGDSGNEVRIAQYYLAVISYFDPFIPQVLIDGEFDQNTLEGVLAFQRQYNLPQTGIIDRETWNLMMSAYNELLRQLRENGIDLDQVSQIYPGRVLTQGMQGDDVSDLQALINRAASINPWIPTVPQSGTFDQQTERAVLDIQASNEILPDNGAVGPLTWGYIVLLGTTPVDPDGAAQNTQ
nr:peptidoglycan-binding protein [bacterium]